MTGPRTTLLVPVATATATIMIALQVASKASRDGFFLEQISVDWLPVMITAGSISSLLTALLVGRALSLYAPVNVAPSLYGLSGGLFLLEALLVDRIPGAIAVLLFLHTSGLGAAVVSGFWSVINERFDPHAARTIVGKLVAGTTFGGALGGGLTWWVSDLEFRWLLLGFGAASLLCAAGVFAIARSGETEHGAKEAPSMFAGVGAVAGEPYLRVIAILVFVIAGATSLIDYVFKATAAQSGDSLIGFFAVFYTVTGVVTFLVQAAGARRVLEAMGVVPSIALLPTTFVLLGALALFFPSVGVLAVLRGGAMVIENSFFRSGYELLFTAVPKAKKRAAKILIDLGSDKLGAAVGGGLALGAVALASGDANTLLLVSALLASGGGVALLVRVQSEYVASLASNLRGVLHKPDSQYQRRRLDQTFAGDLAVVDLQLWSGDTTNQDTPSASTLESVVAEARRRAELKRSTQRFTPAMRVRRTGVSEELLDSPLRRRLRASGSGDEELRESAPAAIGALGDVVLSARESIEVRIRAAELLARVPSERSAAALKELLEVDEMRLRRVAAIALFQLCRASPTLTPDTAFLTRVATNELRRPQPPSDDRNDFESLSPFQHDPYGRNLSPTLENVLLILAIGGGVEDLKLAVAAVTSGHAATRGTGLEYLDNKLPGDLRQHLLALVDNPVRSHTGDTLPIDASLQLVERFRNGELSLRELRREFRRKLRSHYASRATT